MRILPVIKNIYMLTIKNNTYNFYLSIDILPNQEYISLLKFGGAYFEPKKENAIYSFTTFFICFYDSL